MTMPLSVSEREREKDSVCMSPKMTPTILWDIFTSSSLKAILRSMDDASTVFLLFWPRNRKQERQVSISSNGSHASLFSTSSGLCSFSLPLSVVVTQLRISSCSMMFLIPSSVPPYGLCDTLFIIKGQS